MTARQLAEVLVKVLGVYCIVLAIQHASLGITSFAGLLVGNDYSLWEFGESIVYVTPTSGTLALLAWVLLKHGDTIANRIVKSGGQERVQRNAQLLDPLGTAFIVAGVVLLVWHLPAQLATLFVMLWKYAFMNSEVMSGAILEAATTSMIRIALYALLSFVLIARTERVREFVLRLRGMQDHDSEPS